MFRQDRTNPSTAVSNWKGRHDTPKAWSSTAVSSWLNGGLFGSGPTGGTAYFFGSGYTTGWQLNDNIDKMDSATETLATLTSVMATGRWLAAGNGNAGVAAYSVMGAGSGGNTNTTEKISFTSDSISTLGSTNPSGSYYGGGQGTNQGAKAYYMGGNKYPLTATVYDMPFATETWGTLANAMTWAPFNFPTCSDNGVACYAAGTYTGSPTDAVDKMPFATETPAALSDTLATGGSYSNGGFGQYGTTGSVFINFGSNMYEYDISFTTDAVTVGTWTITNRKYATGCSISDTAGYTAGGESFGGGAADWTTTIQKNEFPTMTNSTLSATLSIASRGSTSATNELALI